MLNRLVFIVLLALCASFAAFASDDAPAAAEPTAAEEQARREVWEKCFAEQMNETGAQACLDSCRQIADYKPGWIECQKEKKCGYYDILARYTCDDVVGGHALPVESLRKLQHHHKIPNEHKNKWTPESAQ